MRACEVYINHWPCYFLPILDRFMCSLSLFIPSHSLPLSDRPMTVRRARDDRETKNAQNRHLSCICQKKAVPSDSALLCNSPEVTFAKSCKWQNKINFICTFGFFVVTLQPITDEICKNKWFSSVEMIGTMINRKPISTASGYTEITSMTQQRRNMPSANNANWWKNRILVPLRAVLSSTSGKEKNKYETKSRLWQTK